MDLTATFLDYAGLKTPAEMDSRSIRPLLSGETRSHRELLRSGLDPWRAVFDGRYKLVRGFDESIDGYYSGNATPAFDEMQQHTLLFDLLEDPGENKNLAAGAADIVDRLTPLLRA
jgi:arylsulfatase A-like enzyme